MKFEHMAHGGRRHCLVRRGAVWAQQALAQDAAPAAADQATLVRAARPPAKPIMAWAAKPTKLPPYVAPNRLIYRLADVLARHKGKAQLDAGGLLQPRFHRRMDLHGAGRKDQDPVLCR